jgi:hypothetical protein
MLQLPADMKVVAVIDQHNGYAGLIDGIRGHIAGMNVRLPDVDMRAGLPESYCAKLLTGLRALGPISLGPLLGTAGLKLYLTVDPEVDTAMLSARGSKGPRLDAKPDATPDHARHGRRGRAYYLLTSNSAQRSNAARIAANARWAEHRRRKARLERVRRWRANRKLRLTPAANRSS